MNAAPGMSPAETRRATAWALGVAAAVYLFGWIALNHPPGWMLAAGPLPQWPVALDLFVTVPALYWWLHRRDRRRAWLGALGLAAFAVGAAGYVLPETQGLLWSTLRALRVGGLMLVVLVEFWVVAGALRLALKLRHDSNPDYALGRALREKLGDTFAARALAFDMRVWLQVFGGRRPWRYRGEAHFGYDRKDANASTQQAFLILMLIDLPVTHALLAVFASSTAAWVVTALTVLGLGLMGGHYRATLRCPVSLDAGTLYLRYGLSVAECAIPLNAIAAVQTLRGEQPRRAPGTLRLCDAGEPNLRIQLHEPRVVEGWFGLQRTVASIDLGLDQPAAFLNEFQRLHAAPEPAAPASVHAATPTTNE